MYLAIINRTTIMRVYFNKQQSTYDRAEKWWYPQRIIQNTKYSGGVERVHLCYEHERNHHYYYHHYKCEFTHVCGGVCIHV